MCFLGLKWLLCRVFALWHSTKKPILYILGQSLPSVQYLTLDKDDRFAECPGFDTRQRRHVCLVSDIGHSANNSSLPSVRSGTLGKRAVTVSAPSHYFFRRASVLALGKVFAECPIENTWQNDICRHYRCCVLFAKCYTRQILCRVFYGLCRVPMAHGKATVFGSEYSFPYMVHA